MKVAGMWSIYRRELARLLNDSVSPHLSVAEAEQEAMRLALTAVDVELDR